MTRKQAPAFQFYADDFLAGTCDMSATEVGAYIRLLCFQWSKGPIPSDDARLMRMMGLSPQEFADCKVAVLAKFVPAVDGKIFNERLEAVRSAQQAKSEARAVAGRRGGLMTTRAAGYVYAIRRGSDHGIKLGSSRNPSARRAQLATKHHTHMDLVASWKVPDMDSAERVLHGHFISQRIDGEWFRLSEENLTSAGEILTEFCNTFAANLLEQKRNKKRAKGEGDRSRSKEKKTGEGEGTRSGKYSADFERFWDAFPPGRKTDKGRAFKAWQSAIHRALPEMIITAALEYADSPVGRGDYVKQPATWLNGDCWNDDRASWQRSTKQVPNRTNNTLAAMADFNSKSREPQS